MKMQRRVMLGLGAASVLAAGLGLGVASVSAAASKAEAGKPAPDFEAVDVNGKTVKLSDFRGKTVVLEWTNHECPFVRKHYNSGNMQSLQTAAAGEGVVWLTIISSAKGEQGYVTPDEAKRLTVERKAAPSNNLLDPSGKVGKLYGATATPHMYVIDPKGTLAYMGAIDDKPSTRVEDVKGARSYVKDALSAVKEGRAMDPAATRSYGCTIKYAS